MGDALNQGYGEGCTKKSRGCKLGMLALIVLGVWLHLAYNAHMVWPGKCTGANMKIENGEIRSAQLDGTVVALTMVFPQENVSKTIIYDYCKGEVLNAVEASRAAPK